MIESSLVTYFRHGYPHIISLTRGKETQVEFDFDAVWKFKNSLDHFDPDYLTWLHVHPMGYGTAASMTDVNCARGFQCAFGRVGNFGIVCFKDTDLNNTGCELSWYKLVGEELKVDQHFVEHHGSERYMPTFKHLSLLKALSLCG